MSATQPLSGAPLPAEQLAQVQHLASGLGAEQLWWTSGYLAGLAGVAAATPATASVQDPAATVLYATQTGNSRRVAEALARRFEGRNVRVLSVAEYRMAELSRERQLLLVVSTHGEGEPPDDALPFFERLASPRAPKLPGVRYAVFALGDSSYERFCEVGRILDERLAELGGERLLPRVDCDVEYEAQAGAWREALADVLDLASDSNVVPMRAPAATVPIIDRDRPLAAEVLEVQRITGRGSSSDTFHLEIATPGLAYAPGDSVGIWHHNPPSIVDPVLARLGHDPEAQVSVGDAERTLRVALARHRELTGLTRAVLERYAAAAGRTDLVSWFRELPRARQAEVLAAWQLLDLLETFPAPLEPQALVDVLAPLRPRLYSIASNLPGEEVHLTVSRVAYEHEHRIRLGAASNWLRELEPGAHIPVYVERNAGFHLPADPATPVLMIGAGTGIAPFRAFVDGGGGAVEAGPRWLIFGHRHFRTDFLYQTEWQRHLGTGALSRLDVAFSRDPGDQRYVQHVLEAEADAVRAHLDQGGHVYVCGSIAMGQAVDAVLARIGSGGATDGAAFLAELKAQRRLHRDVY